MSDLKSEIRRERVSVSEDIFHYCLVRCRYKGLEIRGILNIHPDREVGIGVFAEAMLLAVDDYTQFALQDEDHEMVLRPSGLGVSDMVSALDFAGEDIVVDITHALHAFLSEKYGRARVFMSDFLHFRCNLRANIVIFAFWTKYR